MFHKFVTARSICYNVFFIKDKTMHICLKTYSKREKKTLVQVIVTDRLPVHLTGPCELDCELKVHAEKDHYVVTLNSVANLAVTCQRCLAVFDYEHRQLTRLAACNDDMIASMLMARFDDVVVIDDELDLQHMITDELHLLVPERHNCPGDCDQDALSLLGAVCA